MTCLPAELLAYDAVEGKSPDSKMMSATGARALISRLVKDDESRSFQRSLVKGMWGGNPPYTAAQHRRAGLWTANINFGGGKAIMDAAKTPYYHLFAGAQTYINYRTSFLPDHPQHGHWNNVIADRFSAMLDRWPEFDWHMGQHQFWMLFEGYAPVVHDKIGSWKFTALDSPSVLVPNGSPSVLDDRIPYVVVRQPYRAHELWEIIKDEASATALGWNVEAVKFAICNAGSKSGNVDMHNRSWEYWQDKLKNQELETSISELDIIRCGHLLIKECKGKGKGISHFIVTESDFGKDGDNKSDRERSFLFKSPNRFKAYGEFLTVIFQNTGDGTWHSVRGIMMDAFKHIEAQNRLRCRALDGAFIEASLVLQATSQTAKDQMQVTQIGAITWLPPGVTNIQTQLAGSMQGPLAMDRLLGNDLASNLGQFSPRNLGRDDGRGEQPTAEHIRAVSDKEASLSQGQITLYYCGLDRLYDQTYRRAIKANDDEAKRFRQECLDRGVPKEALEQVDYVRANRLSGYGSKRMRQEASKEMMSVLPMLNEEGKRNWLDDYISVVESPDKVDRYNPKTVEPTSDDAWAVLENGLIKSGEMPMIVSGQNHVNHLKIHLAEAQEQLAPVQEAVEMEEADAGMIESAVAYLEILAPHCEEHLQAMSGDTTRAEVVQLFQMQLKNLVAFHGKLRGALIRIRNEMEQAQMEQSQAMALGAMDQAKLESVYADIERKNMKAVADTKLKVSKTINSERLKNWQAQQSNRRATLETVANLRTERINRVQTE